MSLTMGKRALEAASKYVAESFAVAYNYLSMSNVLGDMGLPGCAGWILSASEKNRTNGMKFFRYLGERGVRSKLMPIQVSRQDWRAPLHIFEEAVRQERKLLEMTVVVYESAVADKDYATEHFSAEFFEKHIKAERDVVGLLTRLRKMQTSEAEVFEFDQYIKTFV